MNMIRYEPIVSYQKEVLAIKSAFIEKYKNVSGEAVGFLNLFTFQR